VGLLILIPVFPHHSRLPPYPRFGQADCEILAVSLIRTSFVAGSCRADTTRRTTPRVNGPKRRSSPLLSKTVRRIIIIINVILIAILSTLSQPTPSPPLPQLHPPASRSVPDENLCPCTDQVFLTLYRELYFRHVYARLQPTIDDRFQSYENICELFNYLLSEWSEPG
jgi:hypothetical protein